MTPRIGEHIRVVRPDGSSDEQVVVGYDSRENPQTIPVEAARTEEIDRYLGVTQAMAIRARVLANTFPAA